MDSDAVEWLLNKLFCLTYIAVQFYLKISVSEVLSDSACVAVQFYPKRYSSLQARIVAISAMSL